MILPTTANGHGQGQHGQIGWGRVSRRSAPSAISIIFMPRESGLWSDGAQAVPKYWHSFRSDLDHFFLHLILRVRFNYPPGFGGGRPGFSVEAAAVSKSLWTSLWGSDSYQLGVFLPGEQRNCSDVPWLNSDLRKRGAFISDVQIGVSIYRRSIYIHLSISICLCHKWLYAHI